ncbi:hypothetical protein M430DRAFT_105247 [Amorphotheca resinae ATCC 22711]|uniref:Uncharacterized protein n=1 Tax=Amorphotheca resinae ATCC 22711 TaxID=857342 RepID=A0A2T3AWK8_AMORE|nr:hypothetical protein M430DRAFT_105247 [Amorphotheca resinae ATCC 22711]PSS13043.1 hypothetical protein M430DRAFT_105247 [Amorphotheca resinae ATCC 22711]
MSAPSEAPSDENSLGGFSYEFVDTDEDSRDDNATESVASTDFGRPDDVASLADTQSGDESGEDDGPGTSDAHHFSGLDDNDEHLFSTPTIGQSSAFVPEDLDKPLVQSIEFEEPFNLGAETVSVKHTIADLNEQQTASALKGMTLQNPPKRLAVTIRQTMTKQGLSTRDPLRILYVGSHSAKQDIIHKVASSVTASVDSGNRAQHLRHSASQIYNVVPVSAFGSERTPEIELMYSSGYQIKVEDCILAQSLKYEDTPERPDVIKVTLDGNFSYHSVPDGQGFIVEPHWELPHVAIFYCSDNDDLETRRTATVARKFMGRHGVPSIVISHKQLFDRGQCMSLDQHSIHMCLESRDSNGKGNIIHRRLPIDLASFLNIDARQMNRNLAYITGLHEPLEISNPPGPSKKPQITLVDSQDLEKTPHSISDSASFIRNRSGAEWRALLPVGLLLLSVFTAVFTGLPIYRFSSSPAISINSKVMSAVPISTSSSTPPTPVMSVTSTPAVFKTSTRTITVTHAPSQGSNSLAVLPSMEIGKLTPAVQDRGKPANQSLCSAEILGDREILIRIASATKLSWLTKEALSVNITRGNVSVDTERAYSSNDGIVLLLPKNEAYGVLNISIITTKKPRVNEIFQVDFGTTIAQTWQSILDKLSSLFEEDVALIDTKMFDKMRTMVEKMVEDSHARSRSTFVHMEEARRAATEHAAVTTAHLTDLAKSISLEAAKRSAILSKELGIQFAKAEAKLSKKFQSLEDLREPINSGLLKAQVQSKLLWLKLQGKDEEHREYQERAAEALRSRATGSKKSQAYPGERKQTPRAAKKSAKKEARAAKKGGRKPRT